MNKHIIAPSLLAADFSRLGEETSAVLQAGADMIHFDVMDNHYVPNLSFGPGVLRSLRKAGLQAPVDVHLMTRPVDRLIRDFIEAGANYITFHPEASDHPDRSLQMIRDGGCKAGLALNPATSLSCLEYVPDKLDLILVMSVNPGFGGQTFIPSALKKLRAVRAFIDQHQADILLEVDGGITAENIASAALAGADTFVAGSAIFGADDYTLAISAMRMALQETKR